MDYEDACEATATREEARREIESHSCSFEEFVRDAGDQPTYRGSTVLNWLGY